MKDFTGSANRIVGSTFALLFLWHPTFAEDADTNGLNGTQTEVAMHYRTSCVCCKNWARYMELNGYSVTKTPVLDIQAIKQQLGIPKEARSCHTAKIGDYIIEGHVPAEEIDWMLKHQPDIKGLSVAGMPIGSPGMEGPEDEPYDITIIHHDGSLEILRSIP